MKYLLILLPMFSFGQDSLNYHRDKFTKEDIYKTAWVEYVDSATGTGLTCHFEEFRDKYESHIYFVAGPVKLGHTDCVPENATIGILFENGKSMEIVSNTGFNCENHFVCPVPMRISKLMSKYNIKTFRFNFTKTLVDIDIPDSISHRLIAQITQLENIPKK